MPEFKPVVTYVTIEMWEHEDRSIGYRMRSELDAPFDEAKVGDLLCELAMGYLADFWKSTSIINLNIQANGKSAIFWDKSASFVGWPQYRWLRGSLQKVVWRVNRVDTGEKWRLPFWFLDWLLMRFTMAVKRSLSARHTGGATPPAKLTELLSEPSRGSEAPPKAGGGVVLAFPTTRKREPDA